MTAMRCGFGAAKAAVPLASSVGPSEGATGRPSLVAARSKSCAGMRPRRAALDALLVFEEHAGRAGFEPHGAHQLAERAGQVRALARAERVHAFEQAVLCGGRRAAQERAATRREL